MRVDMYWKKRKIAMGEFKPNLWDETIRQAAAWGLLLFFLSVGPALWAQPKDKETLPGDKDRGTRISGRVLMDGKPVADARLVMEELQLVVKTDKQGKFSLFPVERDSYSLDIYHPQAYPKTVRIKVRQNFNLDIHLTPRSYRKIIFLSKQQRLLEPLSKSELTGQEIQLLPGIMGLSHQAYHTMPAASSPHRLLEKPTVRGLPMSGNSVSYGGTRLLYPYHGLGWYSASNKDDLARMTVYRGVIPVNHSFNSHATHTEMEPQGPQSEGPEYSYRNYSGLFNGFGINATLGSRGYVQLSGRVAPYARIFDLSMNDYQGRAAYEVAPGHKIKLTFAGIQDKWGLQESELYMNNYNHMSSLSYEALFGPAKLEIYGGVQKGKLLFLGDYFLRDMLINFGDDPRAEEYYSDERFREDQMVYHTGLRLYFELLRDHVLEWGFHYERAQQKAYINALNAFWGDDFHPDDDTATYYSVLDREGSMHYTGNRYSSYLRYVAKLGSLGWDAGIRVSYYDLAADYSIAPVLMLFYQMDNKTRLYAGGGMYFHTWDPRWNVAKIDVGEKPSTPLPLAEHIKGELGGESSHGLGFPVKLVGFYEQWQNYPEPLYGTAGELSANMMSDNEDLFVSTVEGYSFGAELSSTLRGQKWRSRASYSYVYAREEGKEPVDNRSHIVNTTLWYHWNHAWDIAAIARLISTTPGTQGGKVFGSGGVEGDFLSVDPVLHLSVRVTRKFLSMKAGSRFFVEISHLEQLLWLAQFPSRYEFSSSDAIDRVLLGRSLGSDASVPVMPGQLGFGLEVVF